MVSRPHHCNNWACSNLPMLFWGYFTDWMWQATLNWQSAKGYISLLLIQYYDYIIFPSVLLAPNTGLYLILQQFWAMFVKKFHISLRAYGFLISQIFVPVVFIVFANILLVSNPGDTRLEPKRALTLDNSALFADNLTLFYAQFGNISTDDSSEPFFLSVSQYCRSFLQRCIQEI